jgi:hypothetical protein
VAPIRERRFVPDPVAAAPEREHIEIPRVGDRLVTDLLELAGTVLPPPRRRLSTLGRGGPGLELFLEALLVLRDRLARAHERNRFQDFAADPV